MATNQEFIVNKKFLYILGTVFFIVNGIVLYALLSPKTVTIQVEKIDNSFTLEKPLDITPPKIN